MEKNSPEASYFSLSFKRCRKRRIGVGNTSRIKKAITLSGGNSKSEKQQPRKTSAPTTLCEDLIPLCFKPWINDIAKRLKTAPETVVVPALVSFSSLIGKNLGIYPKQYDPWFVVPNLWGAVVTESGYLTSQVMAEALVPFEKLAQRCSRYEFGDEKNKNARRQYLTNDSRLDNISRTLRENSTGLLLVKNDLSNWLQHIKRVDCENEREFFLGLWNGYRCLSNLYSGRQTLSIFGRVEPKKLQKYLDKSELENITSDNDLFQRFQLLIYNENSGQEEGLDRNPDLLARENVCNIFRKIDSASRFRRQNIPSVHFSMDAQNVFNDWLIELEYKLRIRKNDNPALLFHLHKYRSLMPSLALIFWILERPENIYGWGSVSLSATVLAVKWCRFLEKHALKIYGLGTNAEVIAMDRPDAHRENFESSIYESAFKTLANMNWN